MTGFAAALLAFTALPVRVGPQRRMERRPRDDITSARRDALASLLDNMISNSSGSSDTIVFIDLLERSKRDHP